MTEETKDLTKRYLQLAWPVVLEMVLISMITAVDTMMVGRLGTQAISAVSLTQQPRLLLLMPIMALNVGLMTTVGMFKGAGERARARRCLQCLLGINFAASGLLVALVFIFMEPILRFAGAQPDTLALSMRYFRYIATGLLFQALGLTITAAQRGIGNTRISMVTNLAANGVNILLNYCLIMGRLGFPAMGIDGAGLATMAGEMVSMLIAVYSAGKPSGYLRLLERIGLQGGLEDIKLVLSVAKGTILERSGQRIGMFFYFKTVAMLGTTQFAVFSICNRFTNLAFSLGDGLGVAAAALVSQSIGAGQLPRAQRFANIGLAVSVITGALFMAASIAGRPLLIPLFTDDAQILELSKIGVVTIALNGLIHIPQVLISGTLRGAGDTLYLARVVLLTTMLYRPVSAYILGIWCGWGLLGIYASLISECAIRFLLTIHRFRSSSWIKSRLLSSGRDTAGYKP